MGHSIDRRTFLGGALVAGMGTALVACSPSNSSSSSTSSSSGTSSQSSAEENYTADETLSADLVVIGAGMSGMSACLEAAQAGKDVVLLEKESVLSGTLSGTEGIFGLNSQQQTDQGLQMPTKWELLETELEYTNWRTNSLLWEDLMNNAGQDVDWLSENGATFQGVDDYLGQSEYSTFHWWEGGTGAVSGQALGEAVQASGVDVHLSTPAVGLVTDNGAVTGVWAKTDDDKMLRIDAPAVIIASGGLANDLDLLAEKTGWNLDGAMSLFPINNVGDGLQMAVKAGAKETPVSMMDVFSITGQAPTDPIVVGTTLQPCNLFINGNGERFMPEDLYINKFFALVTNAWEAQGGAFCIVDSAIIDKMENVGCYCGVAAVKAGDKLEGMRDQLEQACTTGNAYKGDTIEELAQSMGVDADTLASTVERYNTLCAQGNDEDFGKQAQYLMSLETGPFYAVKPIYCVFATMGGIDVDRSMRVLDEDGNPIEGLYSSGTASCGLYKETYCYQVSGGMNAYCCYSGREAARQAIGA